MAIRFAQYAQELAQVKKLEPEEEKALWQSYKQSGDTTARSRLIESYQPLVFKQAQPYAYLEDIMDLVQEGTIGLIESVERFEPERGVAFSLFAMHRIRGRIYNYLAKEGRADIACMDGMSSEEKIPMKDMLMDTAPSVSEQAESHELSQQLHKAMARLPDKEKAVLEGVYMRSEDVRDVAEGLHVSPSHIYRLQKTGIRRVRGMLSRFMHHW